MFSWGKKNDSKKKTRRRGGSAQPALNEFGIPINQQSSGNDEELEAELRALTGGVITMDEDLELNDEGSDVEAEFMRMFGHSKGKKKNKQKETGGKMAEDEASINVDVDITDMNEDDLGGDEDVDVDENDPELLSELMGLTGDDDEGDEEEGEEENESSEEKEKPEKKEVTVTSMLKERLNMYKAAEAKAKENKESSRARRFARGIKTLQQLIKKAEAGQPVLPSEIPPPIATNLKPAPPPAPAPSVVTPTNDEIAQPATDEVPVDNMGNLNIKGDAEDASKEDEFREPEPAPPPQPRPQPPEEPRVVVENPLLKMLSSRRDEYKASALAAKRNNDLETALKHVKCVKQLSALIAAVEQGEEIDESEVPPSLTQPKRSVEKITPLRFEAPDEFEVEEVYEIPRTVLEALNQRLRIYNGFLDKARRMGDDAEARRNAKIVQVYAEAIKLHKAGKKVPLAKLPTPPGCPPIPIPFVIDDDD